MYKFGKLIVKFKIPILIIALVLIIPSFIGMLNTRINYDMLTYLPKDIDTVTGQNILLDDFGKGGISLIVFEDTDIKTVAAAKKKIEKVDHIANVLWYDSIADISIPMEILPESIYTAFNDGNATLMAVFYNTSTSADETMQAVKEIRQIIGKQGFISGMSAVVTDLRDLSEKEEPVYVAVAVILACVGMMIFMDSWLIPFVFLISIGIAVLWNMGTNFFFGEISYITKALASVLQLGVTMDYSIFLWHSYCEKRKEYDSKDDAMAHAIADTLVSVIGSSVTTIAGFIALCFMSFTLGKDLGFVMAKGVIFGVIGCVTTLPAMILVFDKIISKTMHKSIIPDTTKFAKFVTKKAWIFLIIFAILAVPATIGYTKSEVYYDISKSLPEDMEYVIANTKLQEHFDISSTHLILADSKIPAKKAKKMLAEIDKTDGVTLTMGLDSVLGSLVPEEILPESVRSVLKGDKYQLILINSEYKTASDKVNKQLTEINNILKKYDKNGMLIGEAACTKDLIQITDRDFKIVSTISIVVIFIIIALVLKSISIPVILVAVIEFAIFINLGIPFYTGTVLSFVAPICISTIQLGATVDYAILMTTRYKAERFSGKDKQDSISTALATSIPSVLVSACGFFAATFGVSVFSDIDMIASICGLMSRGAIVSMLAVIFILPAMFVVFDKIICRTSLGFINRKKEN